MWAASAGRRADVEGFVFVVTAYNAEPYVPGLVASLAAQTFPSWRAVFVDDASTDGTLGTLDAELSARGLRERFTVLSNSERCYKACNAFRALKDHTRDGEVAAMLDGDDQLIDAQALEILRREYQRGWDVVWSDSIGSDGSPGKSDYLSPLLSLRHQPFVTSHLFTFRTELFAAVNARELQDDRGAWFRSSCDLAVAWPVLEQTRRRRYKPKILYLKNQANPLSHKAAGRKREQVRTVAILRGRPRRRAPADLGFVMANLGYFVWSALMNTRLVRRYLRFARRLRDYRAGKRDIA